MIEQRRAAPRDDLLTRLVEAEVDGERLKQEEILGFFQLLVVGGQETTTNLINNAILCLVENPGPARPPPGGARPAALGDRGGPALPLAVAVDDAHAEARRRTARPDDPGRQARAPDDRLREPRPRQFPRRRPLRHRARSQPAHRVRARHPLLPGRALARLEARIALADLLGRLKGLALASDEPWEPRKALHVHGPTRLPIRFEPGR